MSSELNKDICDLLKVVGPGHMSSLAYDTAWVARLGEIDWDLSNNALNWLCEHQLSDGSWGVEQPFYYHDRVISTLAAMIALTYRGRRDRDKHQIEKGLIALERITSGATQGLQADPNGATVGFEMIIPTLVAEAERLGIVKQQGETILGKLSHSRTAKLAKIRGKAISKKVTMAFSAEMAGMDGQHMLDVENLCEENGSIGHSPSATAYYLLQVNPNNKKALEYLRNVTDDTGGAPDLYPFDVYERSWVLWNLSLFPDWDQEVLKNFKPHLDYLYNSWKPSEGVGFSKGYSVPDGDDSIIAFELLNKFGYDVSIDTVLSFEEQEYFRCYQLEVGISPSVNIHALNSLQKSGFELKHPTVQKILRFLQKSQGDKGFWIDKWHSSPFYTTSHYIIATCNYDANLSAESINWILQNQREDGSWGYLKPNIEETAYCIQSLSIFQKKTGTIDKEIFQKGINWIQENYKAGNYLPLWIGKGLYSPDKVVNSAILSAIALAESVLQ